MIEDVTNREVLRRMGAIYKLVNNQKKVAEIFLQETMRKEGLENITLIRYMKCK